VDVEKIEKAVAAEFAAKRAKKKSQPKPKARNKTAVSG
jgi:hypothetical protein